jgi:hypothetical protein
MNFFLQNKKSRVNLDKSMVKRLKKKLLTVRVAPEILAEFAIVAELRETSMSTLVHQFVTKTIREEKENHPEAFKTKLRPGEFATLEELLKELNIKPEQFQEFRDTVHESELLKAEDAKKFEKINKKKSA